MPLQIVYENEVPRYVDAAVYPLTAAPGPSALLPAEQTAGALRQAAERRNFRPAFISDVPCPVWHGGRTGEMDAVLGALQDAAQLVTAAGCATAVVAMDAFSEAGYPMPDLIHAAGRKLALTVQSGDVRLYFSVRENPYADQMPAELVLVPGLGSFLPDWDADRLPKYSARQLADLPPGLAGRLEAPEETFAELLIRRIEASGMTDSQCYRKANVDRRVFAKIRSNRNYRPQKTTAVAFVFALRLSYVDACELLEAAGYSFSASVPFDIIVKHFICSGNFDIYELNEALFAVNEKLVCS